jgi:hypothetical protein
MVFLMLERSLCLHNIITASQSLRLALRFPSFLFHSIRQGCNFHLKGAPSTVSPISSQWPCLLQCSQKKNRSGCLLSSSFFIPVPVFHTLTNTVSEEWDGVFILYCDLLVSSLCRFLFLSLAMVHVLKT